MSVPPPQLPSTLTVRVLTACLVGDRRVDGRGPAVATVTDEYGVPFIPKYRMSARLRDAALQILGAAGSDDFTLTRAIELFGSSRSTTNNTRLLRVGRASWPDGARASLIAATEAHDLRFGASAFLRERIQSAFTVDITQTRLNADGSAAHGTLRQARAIVPGVVLTARLSWLRPADPGHLQLLARTVLAIDQIGGGETDHLGRVECTLDGNLAATRLLAYPEHASR